MDTIRNQNLSLEEIMKNFKGVTPIHCDHCGFKFSDESFDLVRFKNQHAVIHTKCFNCGYAYMLNFFVPMPGMIGTSKSQLNLDIIETKELVTFAGQRSVSVNDALDAYNYFMKTDELSHYIRRKADGLSTFSGVKRIMPVASDS
jgi:hypothetical protein